MAENGTSSMGPQREQPPGGSWLEKKLSGLEALYHRFGREGLKDHSLADVKLLLSSKELQLRDAAKGRDLGEDQKTANRQLELEIKDQHFEGVILARRHAWPRVLTLPRA
jgi:hypothetical protein